jgi:segregation and condensation protein B
MQTELVETGELKRSLEAILFVATESLSIDALVKLTGASHVEVAETLAAISEDFAGRGIVLREIAGGYRFASAPSVKHVVEAYLLPPKTNLSPAAMETLAIVAYLQPVTRAEIEAIRGVSVDGVVTTLVDKRFIAEAGRREGPGRPMEYRTTSEFLEAFGLRSLSELPPVDLESENLELALPIATLAEGATGVFAAAEDVTETKPAAETETGAGTEAVVPTETTEEGEAAVEGETALVVGPTVETKATVETEPLIEIGPTVETESTVEIGPSVESEPPSESESADPSESDPDSNGELGTEVEVESFEGETILSSTK